VNVEQAVALLQTENPNTEVFVCHWAKSGGTARPIIRPLAEVRWQRDQWHPARLCLMEKDDRGQYLASR